MSEYSSYFLYRKYQVLNGELIDLGITSVDGDGTMPLVTRNECDPACGCQTEPIYRWVTVSGGYECSGTTKMAQEKEQVSNDNGETWSDVSPLTTRPALPVIAYNSEDCGYIPSALKFTLTLSDSSTVTAECDETSALTRSEISAYSASVTSAIIGDCVTELSSTGYGDGVFQGCTGLTSVTIPDSVTTLGAYTFRDCTGITNINIPDSVTTINDNAFDTCTSLTGITIPSGVTVLNTSLFYGCTSLTSVIIPSGITSIGTWGTFYGCTGLASITCLATLPPTLGTSVFDNTNNCPIYVPCASVDTYKAASGWSSYADRIQGIPPCGQPVFEGKYQLTLNDSSTVSAECDSTSSVTSGEVANQYSGTVVSAEIGQCVTSIGNAAFFTCTRLTSVTIPDSVTSIGYSAFANCTGLTSVSIPNSVTIIDDGVFVNCSSLTSIDIPDSVTSIGKWALGNCDSLTSCTIGTGVTSISGDAFGNCSSLASITCLATTPPTLGEYAFLNTNNCPIYVPSGSVNTYKSASGWSSYSSRIQAIP